MPYLSIVTFPLKIKLITLSLLFAALKHYGQLDWQWITVAAPILFGAACTAIEYVWFYVSAVTIAVFGGSKGVSRLCDRLETKVAKNQRTTKEAIEKLRRAASELKH